MTDSCKLSDKKCGPCNHKTPPLSQAQLSEYSMAIPSWEIERDTSTPKIKRDFTFKNFLLAMAFINKMAVIAEEEGHHPDFHLYNYRNVSVSLTTHAIHNLSENDFIVAAKIDAITV